MVALLGLAISHLQVNWRVSKCSLLEVLKKNRLATKDSCICWNFKLASLLEGLQMAVHLQVKSLYNFWAINVFTGIV